jgi:BirA family biotin operon repressor/biotin-[acetyl-CoA-carboxylase] ligase
MDGDLRALKPATRWLGACLEIHDAIDSTNLRGERLAAQGAADGTVVLADSQTAGRGRLGRSFHSPGSVGLYLSVILRSQLGAARAHEHVFAAAVAVAECARAVLPDAVSVEIKWPNDVLVGGRKASGINLLAQSFGPGTDALVLGIGVNVRTRTEDFPAELRDIATSLAREAEAVGADAGLERAAFAAALLARLEAHIDTLRTEGFAPILARWRALCRLIGARVRVATGAAPAPAGSLAGQSMRSLAAQPSRAPGPSLAPPGEVAAQLEGIVEGVDETGALLVSTAGAAGAPGAARVVRVVAGDLTRLPGET